MEVENWIRIPAALVAGTAVFLILTRILRVAQRNPFVKRIRIPVTILSFCASVAILRLVYPFPVPSRAWLGFKAFCLLIGAYAVIASLEFLFFDILLIRRREKPFPVLLRDMLRWILSAVILLIILRFTFDIDISSLIFTSAALTLILGFALQDTLGNLLAGITINLERPFEIGDWISVGSWTGAVVDMTWRATRIRTLDNDYVIIPNASIAKEEVINHHAPSRVHARHLSVGVSYSAPPSRVKQAMVESALATRGVLQKPAPNVTLVEFGDFSITYELKFWIDDFSQYRVIEGDLQSNIWYRFRRYAIEIPFPIRNVTLRTVSEGDLQREEERRRAEIARILMPVDILRPLSEEELITLIPLTKIQRFCADEVLVRQGEPGDSFYVVKEGNVEVLVSSDGKSIKVAELGPGAFFGEGSLLTGEARSATIRALNDVEVVVIDKEAFSKVLQAKPSIAEDLSQIMERRQRENAERIAAQKGEEEASKVVVESSSRILGKIKRFFGLGGGS